MADEAKTPNQESNTGGDATAVEASGTENSAVETNQDAGTGGDDRATETAGDKPTEAKPEGKTFDEKYVKELRAEAAKHRATAEEKAAQAAKDAAAAAEKALTEKLAKALGLVEDETPDPAALLVAAEEQKAEVARERDAYAEKLRELVRKDAISAAVSAVEGDLDAVSDSRKITAEVEKLDTTADDFAAQVAAIVSAAVDSNPKLKKTVQATAPSRSGGDNTGGNATTRRGPQTVDEIRRAMAEKRKRDRI